MPDWIDLLLPATMVALGLLMIFRPRAGGGPRSLAVLLTLLAAVLLLKQILEG